MIQEKLDWRGIRKRKTISNYEVDYEKYQDAKEDLRMIYFSIRLAKETKNSEKIEIFGKEFFEKILELILLRATLERTSQIDFGYAWTKPIQKRK